MGYGARRLMSSKSNVRENLKNLGGKIPNAPKGSGSAVQGLFAVGGLGYLGYNSLFTVQGGHRAVVWSRLEGIKKKTYDEGMHFKVQ